MAGDFNDFVEHVKIVMPTVHKLRDNGLSRDYIARLLRLVADWIDSLDDAQWNKKAGPCT